MSTGVTSTMKNYYLPSGHFLTILRLSKGIKIAAGIFTRTYMLSCALFFGVCYRRVTGFVRFIAAAITSWMICLGGQNSRKASDRWLFAEGGQVTVMTDCTRYYQKGVWCGCTCCSSSLKLFVLWNFWITAIYCSHKLDGYRLGQFSTRVVVISHRHQW